MQFLRFGSGRHAEVALQNPSEVLELAQSGVAVTGIRILTDQCDVRSFVGVVEIEDVTPTTGDTEKLNST